MLWLEITVQVGPDNREIILGQMLELGAGGVQESDPGAFLSLWDELPEECRPEKLPEMKEQVVGYWLANEQGRKVAAKLQAMVGAEAVAVRQVSDDEWLNTDSIGFTELPVGQNWLIYPQRSAEHRADGRQPIYLRPGQAFGTGLHPTTQLCLELLEEVSVGGRALDVGTGSGILTIALSRLGFTDLVACDIDPIAVEVTEANLAMNGIKASVRCVDPANLGEGSFNLIVANILAEVITALIPTFAKLSAVEANLITSGIFAGKADQVEAALHCHGYTVLKRVTKENWTAFWARLGNK